MKLYFSPLSPYVRKVRVLAHEVGLAGRIEPETAVMSPVNPSPKLNVSNPLGKLPALVTDDGVALFDSRVICEYVDSLHGGARMFPPQGQARWTALRRQAAADGILDAAVGVRYETNLRPADKRWTEWIDGQMGKVRRTLDALESETFDRDLDIGTISIACALGYLDFRYPDEQWRAARPRLAAWYEKFSARESMRTTVPVEPR
jgi:glutathione S-transferase